MYYLALDIHIKDTNLPNRLSSTTIVRSILCKALVFKAAGRTAQGPEVEALLHWTSCSLL